MVVDPVFDFAGVGIEEVAVVDPVVFVPVEAALPVVVTVPVLLVEVVVVVVVVELFL